MPKLIKKEVLSERKITLPKTFDEEKRSVRAIILTETPVLRVYDWELVDEILVMSGGDIPESVPLLDSHDRESVRSVMGSITGFKKSEKELEGELTVSSVEDRAFTKIKEGHIRELSGGATVRAYYYIKQGASFEYEGRTYKAEERPIVLAVNWSLEEGSLVARGADPNCTTRSKHIPQKGGQDMPDENKTTENTPVTKEETTQRAAPPAVDTAKISSEAAKAERERISEIHTSCRDLKLPVEFAEKLVTDGVDLSTARAKIMEEVKKSMNDQKTDNVNFGRDERDSLRSNLSVATRRMLGGKLEQTEVSDLSKTEINACQTVQAIIRALCEHHGVRTYAMSNAQVYDVMREAADGYVMQDFAAILQTAGKSILVDMFEAQNPTLPLWTGEMDLATFNQYSQADLTPIAGLDVVQEMHPLPQLQINEAAETVKLLTNAGVVTFSRQAIISDTLGGFRSILASLAEAAVRKLEKVGYAKLADLNFAADSITPAALSLDSIEELNTLLLERTVTVENKYGEIDAEEEIGAPGQYLIVPSRLSRTAFELTKSPVYGLDHVVNPYYGQLSAIHTPFLADKSAYYLAGSRGKTLMRYYLNGQRTPILDTFQSRGTEALGVQFRIIFDVAVAVISKYYLAKNAGASPATTTTPAPTTTTGAPTTTTTTPPTTTTLG